jgi:hypothetical protein
MLVMYSGTEIQAEMVKGVLEDAGIAVNVRATTQLGPTGECDIGIYVSDEDYERAAEIVSYYAVKHSECQTCGYQLTGLWEPRCPECGTPFYMPPHQEPWKCSRCGDEHEGHFTECWSCGSPRPELRLKAPDANL